MLSLESVAWNRLPEYGFKSAPPFRGEGSEVSTVIDGILHPKNVNQKKIGTTQKKDAGVQDSTKNDKYRNFHIQSSPSV